VVLGETISRFSEAKHRLTTATIRPFHAFVKAALAKAWRKRPRWATPSPPRAPGNYSGNALPYLSHRWRAGRPLEIEVVGWR
jgi:hypothetical protein